MAIALASTAGCGQKDAATTTAPADIADDAGPDAGGGAKTDAPQLPADRPVLVWSNDAASKANLQHLPANFGEPDQTVCAKDPTRQYIAEMFKYGIGNIMVDWHWAPVISGPNPTKPTLNQPEFNLAGEVEGVSISDDDVLADHPFGLDVNSNIKLDTEFAYLGHADAGEGGAGFLHSEVERNIYPYDSFGFLPKVGDRTLMRGVWVLDCGHPPYGTELHPPSFIAYGHKKDDKTTESLTFFAPYRSSLFFHPSVDLATDLSSTARFDDAQTQSFPRALIATVIDALANQADHLTAHALMVDNRFDSLQFSVCAPLPRPAGAKLDASWRFVARSGVTVTATPDDAQGCVHVTATMSKDYKPLPLKAHSVPWPWEQLSKSAGGQLGASIDVRLEVIKIAQSLGFDPSQVPALKADHPPQIDGYQPLTLRPNANQDAPTAIEDHADDQAYPFYGRVRAAWK